GPARAPRQIRVGPPIRQTSPRQDAICRDTPSIFLARTARPSSIQARACFPVLARHPVVLAGGLRPRRAEGAPGGGWAGESARLAGWDSNSDARSDSTKHPTQTPRAGATSPNSPVISHTITRVENGVLAAAAKNPAIPSRAHAAGGGAK